MESKEVRLAKKIVTLLKDEEYSDAVKALKLAKILLPTPAERKRVEKKKEEAEEKEADKGSLVPADEELLKFSRAMGGATPAVAEAEPEQGMDIE